MTKINLLNIINAKLKEHPRHQLFREAILAVSAADDMRYPQLKQIIGPWHQNPNQLFEPAKTVISYFVPFSEQVVNAPKNSEQVAAIWGQAYLSINAAFNDINQALAAALAEQNYQSFAIAATHTYSPQDLQSMWSHRSAAVIAGLGHFGANRLVITEKGSGGRFSTLLTDAPAALIEGAITSPAKDYCLYNTNESCLLCHKICPVSALKIDDFERFACHDDVLIKNAHQLEATVGFADVCGKCISVCPWAYRQ